MKTKSKILLIIIAIMLLSFVIGVFAQYTEATTPTMIWVDGPTENFTCKKNLWIYGWVLSQEKDKTIKFYIDNNEITDKIIFYARDDVFQAIQGYGTKASNPKPGYDGAIDISNLKDGQHKLIIRVSNSKGQEIASKEVKFNIKKYNTLLQYDTPTQNANVKTNFTVQGWVLSEDSEATVEVQFNGKTYKPERQARTDVFKVVSGFGGTATNKTPGYKINIDTSNMKDGTYDVKVIVKSRTGEIIAQQSRKVAIRKYETLLQYDTPIQNVKIKRNFQVQGWVLSEDSEATVEVQFDGKTYTPEREVRNDVFGVVSGFGGKTTNKTPGYRVIINTEKVKDGTHEVKVIVKSRTGEILAQQSRNIIVKKYDTLIQLDTPVANSTVKTSFTVQGWILSEDPKATVEVQFNGQTYNPERQSRNDVFKVVSGYGGSSTNKTPGYKITLNTENVKDGASSIKIVVKSGTGETIAEQSRTFNIKKYTGVITIDYPQAGSNHKENSLLIQGWNLSSQSNRRIEVYINNTNVTSSMTTYARNDAVEAMKGKGYGDANTNKNAGFSGTINISGYAKGDYTLKVRVISNVTNDVITEKSIVFGIKKVDFERGVFGYSGLKVKGDSRGQDLRYYKVGSGPNVFFAVFTLHGFEDNFGRDGTEISVIAENFVNRLLTDQDASLLNKWTIYIFPDVNVDGRIYGYTNNGPGRTTLTSASGNNGIDLNRCWSTSFVPMYNSRNYTGSQPFLAYEARYLRDFLLSKRATNGQTILVDLHGWTTQVIGDSGICNYYKQQLPSCRYTSSYGKGYLINWARENLGANGRTARSALIELPNIGANGKKIMSHQDVVNSGYSDKYINATLNMLRGIV